MKSIGNIFLLKLELAISFTVIMLPNPSNVLDWGNGRKFFSH